MTKVLQNKDKSLGLPGKWKVITMTLLLLTFSIGQMWGAERQIPTTVLTLPTTGLSSTWSSSFTASHYYYHDNTNHYVIYYPYAVRMSKSTQTWVADDGGGSTEISDGYSSTGIFKGFTYFNALDGSSKKRCDKLAKSTGTIVTYRVTNCTAVSAYIKLGKKNDVVHLKCYVMTEDTPAESAAKSDSYTDASSASTGILNLTGLDAKKEYLVEIYNAGGGSNAQFYEIAFYYPVYTVTYDLNGGTGTTPTEDDQPLGAKFDLHDGVTGITPPTSQEFLKWKDQDADEYDGGDEYTMPAKNVTLTAQWGTAAPKYDITFNNGGHGTAPSATNASKVTLEELSASGWVHTGWVADKTVTVDEVEVTAGTKIANGKTAHLSANTEFTAQWSQLYTITEGTPSNGSVDADLAEAVAGATVTITATPAEDYVFSAWDVYKTGESGTKVSVTETAGVYTFAMPAYAVTVSATFAADTRPKVLYVTKNNEATTKSSDKLYEALKDDYNITIVGAASDADQSGYALVVLHESIDGSNYNATAVAAAKAGNKPVLNTKSYFYNDGRFGWGTPNAGTSVKGATLNSAAYCNIADHPLFTDVTVSEGFFEITDDAAAKCMQPVGSFTSGKEGYTLATTPNNGDGAGNGCAIHELTPTQRGASAGKYLLISVSNAKLDALNANGQKLFQNAAAYLIGSTAWEPIAVPTSATIEATGGAAHIVGDAVTLTASATGVSASTLYTWYKGETLADAQEAGSIQSPETAANNGHKYTIGSCELTSADTYWCVIVNAAGCETSASLELTVSDASYDITFNNGGHGTAPSATTGVSYTLPALSASGWAHQGWTASIDVTVDAATVTTGTTIANGKTATFAADVEFTAVWKQEFQVTYNLQGHGDPIAAQIVLDGELATDPGDPSEIGYDFGGWFTDEECTAGNEWDFANDVVTANTPLYAKWTAFGGCTLLVPATSGDAPAVGDAISMQTGSTGGTMRVVGTPLSYNTYGLGFDSSSSAKAKVTINNDIQEGTVISLTLVANGTSAPRGLHLYTGDGETKIESLGWTSEVVKYTEETFTYTVKSTDVALIGTNEFQLWRNGSVYLKQLTVTNCGDPIIFHNLTSAVDPTGKGTVTLGAGSVREGYTTTAEYSGIDAAYEFDEWQISGTGATLSSTTANPVTITMGTADAVVTLKLKAATPKHTVTFNKMGKGDDIASQEVKEGDLVEEPTVTEPEGWILEGWYTESTLENKWDFASDVMSTSDIELFANWVADTSIKLLSGSTVNHTDFITGVTAETVEISSVDYDCVKFSGTVSSVTGVKDLTRVIAYNAKTNKTKIQLHLYNTSTSTRTVLVKGVLEGNTSTDDIVDLASITLGNKEEKTTDYIEFNNAANRTIYIFIGSSAGDVRFLQVKVIDDGTTPMKAAGQAGYSLNLNKGRFFGTASTDLAFEGLNVRLSGDYTAMNSGYAKLTSTSMSFTVASAMTLSVTTNNNKTYYVTKGSAGTDNETAKTGVSEFDLTAGTWYITAGSNEVQFTNIAFVAPKCEQPTVADMSDVELCADDAYTALAVSASVSDEGTLHYAWFKEAGATDEAVGSDAASYTPEADGEYYVIVTNKKDGFSDNSKTSNTISVAHFAGTTITGYANASGAAGATGKQISVTAEGAGTLHYVWYTCDDELGTNPVAIEPANDAATLSNITIPTGTQYYKVVVTGNCGSAEQILFAKEWSDVELQDVTGSMTWNWKVSENPDAWTGIDGDITIASTSVLANVNYGQIPNVANFHSAMLKAVVGTVETKIRKSTDGGVIQGNEIMFHTTVPGIVLVTYRGTGNSANVTLTIGSETLPTYAGSMTTSKKVFVPAGDVVISSGTDAFRIQKIQFIAEADYTRDVTPGRYGTICLPNGGVMTGASIFEIAYYDAPSQKIFFDEVLNGTMVAGTPYIFLPNEGVYELGVFYTDAAAAPAGHVNGLYGSYTEEVLDTDGSNYILLNNQYCRVVNANTRVGANRAYIKLEEVPNYPTSAPLPGRRRVSMSVQGVQAPTGLDELNAGDAPVKVMINGELFILRGEKMYDATGRLVK